MWKIQDRSDHNPDMERLVCQYNNQILAAERCRRENAGKMTVKEAEYYDQAAKTCEQIMRLNLSEQAVYTKWSGRKQECLRMIDEIADVLVPKATVPPAPPEPPAPAPPEPPAPAPPEPPAPADSRLSPVPFHGLDQVRCMGHLTERFRTEVRYRTDPLWNSHPFKSYCFYGPPNCGKRYLAQAFAHDLAEHSFRFVRLCAADRKGLSQKQLEALPGAAFQEALDNAPCVILVEDLEQFCRDRTAPNPIRDQFVQCVEFLIAWSDLRSSKKEIVFIGITDDPQSAEPSLLDKSYTIRFPFPGDEQRQEFFSQQLEDLSFGTDLTLEALADCTENRDFRELTHLADILRRKAAECPLTLAMLEEILAENPATDKADAVQRLKAYENSFLN